MDPLFIVALVVVIAIFVGQHVLEGPGRRARTIELAPNVTVRLTAEQQADHAVRRNLQFQQIEIAAYNRGEIGHELYGNRMAAINHVPQAVRKPGLGGLMGPD